MKLSPPIVMLPDEERAAFFFALIYSKYHLQDYMKEKRYTPIDCNRYDIFTDAAVLKKPITLNIQTSEGENVVTDLVVDMVTENKIEYIVLAKNGKHRLDEVRIVSV
ncbi:MAG: hypothetical protein IPH61_00640 [Bacteroidetes bacterium]|nr:hypothetical protein [Bacteroidota bacterium]